MGKREKEGERQREEKRQTKRERLKIERDRLGGLRDTSLYIRKRDGWIERDSERDRGGTF